MLLLEELSAQLMSCRTTEVMHSDDGMYIICARLVGTFQKPAEGVVILSFGSVLTAK